MKLGHAFARIGLFLLLILSAGCTHFGHYPVNEPLKEYNPGYGYVLPNMVSPDNSEELLLILSFSGGGTRAAAFPTVSLRNSEPQRLPSTAGNEASYKRWISSRAFRVEALPLPIMAFSTTVFLKISKAVS